MSLSYRRRRSWISGTGTGRVRIDTTATGPLWMLGVVDVMFEKRPGGGSTALIDRPDGVRLRLRSYDRKFAVPHDLAHFVAERAFRLRGGLWGSIEAGAMLASLEVVSGRLRHDRRARSDTVLRAHAAEFGMAEVLAGVVHLGLDQDDRTITRELANAWGVFRADPSPFPAASAVAAVAELRALGRRFTELRGDATLPLTWTVRPRRRTR